MTGAGFQATPLREVRTGRVQQLGTTTIMTGFAKAQRSGPVALGPLGLDGDEQGEKVIHGGPDKAVLHYAADHYASWRSDVPESDALFGPGGFGENFVSEKIDETNVCIGDVLRIGAVVVQVSQPRQPCFKLNHRFGRSDMSQRTQDTGRSGWYCRVLEPGQVEAGNPIALVDRPQPDWTVRRVQHHLYVDIANQGAVRVLVEMPELAEAMRKLFSRRLETRAIEDWNERLVDADNAVAPHRPGHRPP